ncbi:hypothetical protein ACFVZT_44580 [Streptomyces sp. NPDC058321]|uniref:hypothetical protein n=1 Tax=Streptomyces sp. NPDC058321 TaxID=3346445 RepID=UPI0036ED15F0
MSRSSAGDVIGGCIGVAVVILLFGAFLISKVGDPGDGLPSEPASRPTATTETTTRADLPDDAGGTGGQNSNKQAGIQFGYACTPVGALGNAKDGRPAKCYMGKDGRARWGYDSNRG